MKVELIIYIYGAVCISMILFNGLMILVNRDRRRRMDRKDRKFDRLIRRQEEKLRAGETSGRKHLRKMERSLKHIGNLFAFEETMNQIKEQDEALGERYLKELYPVFVNLSWYYRKKDIMYTTYFVYLLREYRIISDCTDERMTAFLLELLERPGVSCRENVMQVFYDIGDVKFVILALQRLDQSGIYWHPKQIHDGLLRFGGDREELLRALWEKFDTFQTAMQVTILNYMRLSDGSCQEQMMELLEKEKQDDEICFACIRYFGRYYYEPAKELLLSFVEKEKEKRWEYAAICATALASYPGEQTIRVLSQAIDSSNWYVRNNAANSLQALGLTYLDLAHVLDGNSRYAREIMQYWLDYREVKEERQA